MENDSRSTASNIMRRFKFVSLQFMVLCMVLGCLAIAILDEEFRPVFADLTKVMISGFLGHLVPRNEG